MLKLKYLIENPDLARLALTHWPHDKASLDLALRRFRISDNAVYPFYQDGRLCFLRLAPASEKRPGALESELAFIQALRAKGYPALMPLPSDSGALLLTLSTPCGDWYAQAFVGVPGKPIDQLPLTRPILFAWGQALGRLHALDVTPSPCPWQHDQALDWAGQTLIACHAPKKILSALYRLRDDLAALPQTKGQYGLVHYDFEPDNVFWDEATGTCSVIDFADCMRCWYSLDIQQALGELTEEADREIFLQGYQQARPLPEHLDQLLPLMQRFIDLYGYARILRCITDPPARQPDWMPGLIRHLQHILEVRAANILR